MAACSVGNTLDDEPDSVGVTERTESACQQANTKAGTSGQAGRLFVSTRPQSKLPLTTHASRLPSSPVAPPNRSAAFLAASCCSSNLWYYVSFQLSASITYGSGPVVALKSHHRGAIALTGRSLPVEVNGQPRTEWASRLGRGYVPQRTDHSGEDGTYFFATKNLPANAQILAPTAASMVSRISRSR